MSSFSSPSPSVPSASAHDEILDAIANVNLSGALAGGSTQNPSSLTGELPRSLGGFVDNDKEHKRVKIVFMSSSLIEDTCCGHIGDKDNVFCLKLKSSCQSYLNGGKHKTTRFEPKPNTYYICRNSTGESAWSNYTISQQQIKNKTSFIKDLHSSKTLVEWKILFQACKQVDASTGNDEDFKQVVKFMNLPPDVKNLKTPSKLRNLSANIQEDDKSFPFSSQNIDSEVALLQLSESDILALKNALVPDELTNLIMGITTILQKIVFQFREI